MNFRYKFAQFMYGRYGVDTLFYILFGIAIILSVLNIFLGSGALQLVVYVIDTFAIFRMFSRNIQARSKENYYATCLFKRIKDKTIQNRMQKADRMHVYKKCPKCRATLRLPRRIGKHTTVCPKCNNSFKVTVKK